MMNRIVTRQFLRHRFWVATFVLLVAIAGSAGIMIQAVGAQADRGNYLVAFHNLNDAAVRLERELTRLSDVPEGDVADRQKARAGFVELQKPLYRSKTFLGNRWLDVRSVIPVDDLRNDGFLCRQIHALFPDTFIESKLASGFVDQVTGFGGGYISE